MRTCHEEGCTKIGEVQLHGPIDLCDAHFKERCADDSLPSMGPMFGPTTLEIRYDPHMGQTVPDALVMDCVEAKIKEFTDSKGDMTHIVGSEMLLYAYRVAVKRSLIEPYHVYITGPKKEHIQIDSDGNPDKVFEDPDILNALLMELF